MPAFDADLAAVSFQYPPRPELGDLALTAPFDLPRPRRKPREIAERLAADLAGAPRRAQGRGRGRRLREPLPASAAPWPASCTRSLRGRPLAAGAAAHVIVEHTSINPNKAAHIGHLRNAVLGDTFVRVLRERGHDGGGPELHRRHGRAGGGRGGGLPAPGGEGATRRSEALAPGPLRLLLLGPLRAGGRLLRRRPRATRSCQAETLHAIEAGRQRHRAAGRAGGRAHRGLPPGHHGAAGHPLRPAGPRERHPAPALLGPRLRAAEGEAAPSAWRPRARTRAAGCSPWSEASGGPHGRRQDHRALQRHGHLHRQGHRLPALEAGPARPRLPLPPPPRVRRRPRALDHHQRRGRAGRAALRPRPRRSTT